MPKFTSDAEIFAAAHQCVAFAGLSCRSDSGRVKVFLFSSSDSYQPAERKGKRLSLVEKEENMPSLAYKRILPTYNFW